MFQINFAVIHKCRTEAEVAFTLWEVQAVYKLQVLISFKLKCIFVFYLLTIVFDNDWLLLV